LKQGFTKKVIYQKICTKFKVSLSTSRKYYSASGIDRHAKIKEVTGEVMPDEKDIPEGGNEETSDEQIYAELRASLLHLSRKAVWPKDRISASKELIKLMASSEYVALKNKGKKKPTMEEIGTTVSAMLLGVSPDTMKAYKTIKDKRKKDA